jgi:hypothetical protein
MTLATKHDEILLAIRSRLASANDVMDLELISPAALLALPAIPLKNLEAELPVILGFKPQRRNSGIFCAHADRLILSRKSCCCRAGRKWKNRSSDISSTSGLPFSKFAPARKSAQIISRQ